MSAPAVRRLGPPAVRKIDALTVRRLGARAVRKLSAPLAMRWFGLLLLGMNWVVELLMKKVVIMNNDKFICVSVCC